jgi:WD40 repeat protein
LHCFAEHETMASALALFPDGRHALLGSYDGTLTLLDLQTGQRVRTRTGNAEEIGAMTLNPDRGHVSFDPKNPTLGPWEGQLGEEIHNLHRELWASRNRHIQALMILLNKSHSISAVSVTSTGRCVLSGSYDGALQLWDRRTGKFIRSFVGHADSVNAVAVAPDDRHALSGSADGTLLLWRMATGELLHAFTEHGGPVTTVAICPDGRHALSGSRDRTLRLWDLEQRVCRAIVPLEGAPLAVALASDGRNVVVGDRVGNVHQFHVHF